MTFQTQDHDLYIASESSGTLPHLLRTPRLDGNDPKAKRLEIARYFTNTFDVYTRLFDCLADDKGYFQKSIPLRHPLIFYLGHTATFFVNKLVLAKLLPERIDPEMESTFAVGVDEMSWDDLNEDHYEWPSVGDLQPSCPYSCV